MAQLKDTIVNGGLRATESVASPIGQFDTIYAKEEVSTGITENYTSGEDKKILQSGTFDSKKTTYWASLSPIIDLTQGTSENGPKIGATIAGVSTPPNDKTEINIATPNIYGVTKLTGSYNASTPNNNLAATGEAIKAAIGTLNSNIPDSSNPNLEIAGANKTLTALSIQSGKIDAATFTEIAIDSSQITSGIGRNTILYGDSTGVIQSVAPAWGDWDNGTAAGPQAKIQIGAITYTSPAIPAASTTISGVVTTEDQSFSGRKTFTGMYLSLTPATGEGGEIHLNASTANTTQAGIVLDQYNSTFRIFGIASADGETINGVGTPLVIDPYNKTITGGYTLTGSLTGHASLDLPLTGGTLTDSLTIQKNGLWIQGGSAAGSNNSRMELTSGMPDAFPYNQSKRGVKIYSNAIALADPYNGNSNNDAGWLRHIEETANSGVLELGVGDDGNESIVARQYNTSSAIVRTLTLLNASGNSDFPGAITGASTITAGTYVLANTYVQAKNHMYLDTGHFYMKYNNNWYGVLHNHANGNISITAAGNGLHIGYEYTTDSHFYYSSRTSRTERFTINANGSYMLDTWYIGSAGAGGQINGAATNGGINSIRIGDDVWLGDCNSGGIMGMKSTETNCGFYFYNNSGTQIGQLYCRGANGDIYSNKPLIAPSTASSWLDGLRYERGGFNLADATNGDSYWPWMRQTNTDTGKWFSMGTLGTSFYIIGSATSRTANGYDYGWRFDLSNGYLYGNFSGSLSGHASSDLALSGGTMTGDLLFANSGTATRQIRGIVGDNDYWRIAGGATAANAGWMEIATADDGNEPIYVRQYTGAYATITRTLTLLDASGNTSLPGNLTISHATNATMTAASTNPQITFAKNGGQPVHLIYTDYDSYRSPAGLKVIGGTNATPAWFEVEGQVYAARFNGPLTGNVTGNCSGSSTSCTGNAATATTLNGYTMAIGTNNTTDTWVPVLTGSTWQHRVLPAWLNSLSTVAINHGGTGATSKSGARTNLGIRVGYIATTGAVAAGSYKDYTISFSPAFASSPIVIPGFSSGTNASGFGKCSVEVTTTSTTGATIRILNGDTTGRSPSLVWIAIGD